MTTFDFSPLYRTSIGFDRLASLMSAATRHEQGNSYPPYNIRAVSEDQYRITMAVAGFGEDDLDVTVKENSLTIKGKKADSEPEKVKYLYRGIATRSFERRFELADHIKVSGANLENGVLSLNLVREVPEAMKPRSIKIGSAATTKPKVIEGSAA